MRSHVERPNKPSIEARGGRQLALPLASTHLLVARREPYVLTSAVRRHRARADIEKKVRYCLTFFPELEGRPFGLGLTRQAQGLASLEDFAIWLNPNRLSLHTISHEVTHLLQADRRVPGGERACDVFALTRHPSLNDSRPNYLNMPGTLFDDRDRTRPGWARVLFELARAAVERRALGLRTYIRWFEMETARIASLGVVVD